MKWPGRAERRIGWRRALGSTASTAIKSIWIGTSEQRRRTRKWARLISHSTLPWNNKSILLERLTKIKTRRRYKRRLIARGSSSPRHRGQVNPQPIKEHWPTIGSRCLALLARRTMSLKGGRAYVHRVAFLLRTTMANLFAPWLTTNPATSSKI